MATIVFSGGHELAVRDSAAELLTRLQSGSAMTVEGHQLRLQGWMLVSPEAGSDQCPINAFAIAYIKP